MNDAVTYFRSKTVTDGLQVKLPPVITYIITQRYKASS